MPGYPGEPGVADAKDQTLREFNGIEKGCLMGPFAFVRDRGSGY